MKKIVYLCLFTFFAINLSCNKEEILLEEQNRNSNNIESVEELEKGKLPQRDDNLNLNVSASGQAVGFGDGDGNIFDGSNNGNNAPTENYWTLLTEYPLGTTAAQKAAIRIPYQVNGQLLYFEQCPNDPNKELWYMYHNSSQPNNRVDPLGNPKSDDPLFPTTYPASSTEFVALNINESCDD